MFKLFCRNIASWLAVGTLLASCRSVSTIPPVAGPTRTVAHVKGKSQVPISPQRVVVLDTAPLDATLALGIKPVGTIVYSQPPEYLGDEVTDIETVGEGNQPNLETILKLKPDLILSSKVGTEQLYRQLSQIAPTVLAEDSGRTGDWPKHFRLYAEALGKSGQAEQLLQNYQAQVEQVKRQINQPENTEVSVLTFYEEKIGAYTVGSFSGSVLQDLDLTRNPSQSATWQYALQLSREAVTKLDGDFIFLIYSANFPGGMKKADFVSDPVFSQLNAVKQNQVCEVANEVWIAGRSILAARQILSDVKRCLK